jgi:ABC-2 type transport system ATP-binding protein
VHQLTIHQLADDLRRQQLAAAQQQRPARRLLALRRTTRRVKRRMRRAARQAQQLRARRETEPGPAGADRIGRYRSDPPGDCREAPMSGARDVLEVRELSVAYGSVKAVNGVSFCIGRGEIFGLLGRNGAGKTSTLSAIEGLLRPGSGTVLLDGTDIRNDPRRARQQMSVAFQATSFQPELTVSQILQLYAGLYGVRLSRDQVGARLADAGIDALAGCVARQLSGGQRQRLALCVALIHTPLLLLLDEPTAGLDPHSRRQLWRGIGDIKGRGSVLLTTHSMEEAQAVCDRVAIIDHGVLLATGTPRALIDGHRDDEPVRAAAHGEVTLEDVFIGLTRSMIDA